MNTEALELVLRERRRQIENGFTSQHDDTHEEGELVRASIAYGAKTLPQYARLYVNPKMYPWETKFFEEDDIENLTISCALMLAELERKLRIREDKS